MRDERGAIAIVVAAAMVALIGILAIVADVGLLYQQRRQLQTAVDAAALAGAMEMAEGRGQAAARDTAQTYVAQNGRVPGVATQVDFPTGRSVNVRAGVDRQLFFARIFGRDKANVKAKATATFGAATSVKNLLPIIVPQQFVGDHVGAENAGTFEFGEDRPVDPFSKGVTVSGSTYTYRIEFINSYGRTVDVSMRDPLPANLAYVEGSADGGGVYTSSDRTIRWAVSGLADGASVVRTFRATSSTGQDDNTAYADVTGDTRTLSASTQGASGQRGYFWLCDFNRGSGGVPPYDEWIRGGYPQDVSVGSVANGTGMKVALKDALDFRLLDHPKVLLPLFDYTEGGGHGGEYHVVGFVEFVITGFNFSGANKTVTGYFTSGTVALGTSEGEPPADGGVKVLWLSE